MSAQAPPEAVGQGARNVRGPGLGEARPSGSERLHFPRVGRSRGLPARRTGETPSVRCRGRDPGSRSGQHPRLRGGRPAAGGRAGAPGGAAQRWPPCSLIFTARDGNFPTVRADPAPAAGEPGSWTRAAAGVRGGDKPCPQDLVPLWLWGDVAAEPRPCWVSECVKEPGAGPALRWPRSRAPRRGRG